MPQLGRAETRAAIDAAARAFPAWRKKTAKERAAVLRRWFDLMMANQDDLARLMTTEQGKPLAESRGEVAYAASFLEWFGEEAKRVYGDTIPGHQPDKRIVVIKEPIGVVACITPWNFPLAMITRKAGPAIAAGCTVVLKPASQTPFSALALAELAERAGVPKGVFNVITGSATEIGGELTQQPDRPQAVVHRLDRDRQAADGAVRDARSRSCRSSSAATRRSSCSTMRIWMRRSRARSRRSTATPARPASARTGCSCRTRSTTRSPAKLADGGAEAEAGARHSTPARRRARSSTTSAVEKVESHIADATSKGAKVLVGGKRHALGGRFFEPTILTDVTPAMAVAREETFGPVAPLFRFKTEAEAIALANDTEFGLAAYFYGRDIGRIWRVAEALEYGIVGINTGHHLDRGRAVWRREGIGPRPRGIEVRARGVSRDQISLPGWHLRDVEELRI